MNSSQLDLVIPGSRYIGPDGVQAVVDSLVERVSGDDPGFWVYYTVQGRQYICLLGAFKERFRKIQNG